MFKAGIVPYTLDFKTPAKTSRNTIENKELFLLFLSDDKHPARYGIGEISPFPGLSIDDRPDFPDKLRNTLAYLNEGLPLDMLQLDEFPSIRFGLESALLDLELGGKRKLFDTPFFEGKAGIPINGLIWMGDRSHMLSQIEDKIEAGFSCIKLKVGALDFDEECRLLEQVRKKYSAFSIELRVDANGAFPPEEALTMLKDLSRFELHSIEQPIARGRWEQMQEICAKSPVKVALDEELLGVNPSEAEKMISFIRPHYLIIKPGLLGGFVTSNAWIDAAGKAETGWWITSALESNIGLNAIAQYAASLNVAIPQGLGTGQLFTNNFDGPLFINKGYLIHDPGRQWQIQNIVDKGAKSF